MEDGVGYGRHALHLHGDVAVLCEAEEDNGGVAQDGYPKQLEIDWVRVWQRPGAGSEVPGQGGK